MSKTNDILRALGYANTHQTETGKKPLCKKTTKATLQSAIDEEKADEGKGNNKK